MLVAGGATAKSNRIMCLSSSGLGLPDGNCSAVDPKTGAITPGTMTSTPVNPGGKTATMVIVRNDDSQTLNHVTIAGGDAADNKPYNQLFLPPSPHSMNGLTFAAVISQSTAITCDPNTSTSFECEIGTLLPTQSASFLVVINAPPDTVSHPWWVTADWNEGWSTNGTNADYTFATGAVKATNANCADGAANYFLSGDKVNVGNGGANCGNQNANVQSRDPLTGNGGFATLKVDGSFAVTCPSGIRCLGNTMSASVLGGQSVPGGVQWTITIFGTKTIKGILHFADDYNTNPTHYVNITLVKANQCSDTKPRDCWSSIETSPSGAKPSWIKVVIVTDSNGKTGYW